MKLKTDSILQVANVIYVDAIRLHFLSILYLIHLQKYVCPDDSHVLVEVCLNNVYFDSNNVCFAFNILYAKVIQCYNSREYPHGQRFDLRIQIVKNQNSYDNE